MVEGETEKETREAKQTKTGDGATDNKEKTMRDSDTDIRYLVSRLKCFGLLRCKHDFLNI